MPVLGCHVPATQAAVAEPLSILELSVAVSDEPVGVLAKDALQVLPLTVQFSVCAVHGGYVQQVKVSAGEVPLLQVPTVLWKEDAKAGLAAQLA